MRRRWEIFLHPPAPASGCCSPFGGTDWGGGQKSPFPPGSRTRPVTRRRLAPTAPTAPSGPAGTGTGRTGHRHTDTPDTGTPDTGTPAPAGPPASGTRAGGGSLSCSAGRGPRLLQHEASCWRSCWAVEGVQVGVLDLGVLDLAEAVARQHLVARVLQAHRRVGALVVPLLEEPRASPRAGEMPFRAARLRPVKGVRGSDPAPL